MVSCLLLLHASHVRVAGGSDRNVTACGMSLEDEHVGAQLFAIDPSDATCPSCIAVRDAARTGDGATTPANAQAFAPWFFEQVLNRQDVALLAEVTDPDLAVRLSPARLARLHALFPDWRARIHETIAQGDAALVRYDVEFTDSLGLLGRDGAAHGKDQAVILRLRGSLLSDVTAIVDDFDLWPRPAQRTPPWSMREPARP